MNDHELWADDELVQLQDEKQDLELLCVLLHDLVQAHAEHRNAPRASLSWIQAGTMIRAAFEQLNEDIPDWDSRINNMRKGLPF